MSELSLSRKVEKVLTAYYLDAIDDADLNVYEGHEKAEIIEFPYLLVYAEDAVAHPDMPSHTGVRIVNLRLELRIDSEDTGARALLDGWRMILEDYSSDMDAIVEISTGASLASSSANPFATVSLAFIHVSFRIIVRISCTSMPVFAV